MPRKEKKDSYLFDEDNYINYIEFAKSTGLPFTIKQSNYTCELITSYRKPIKFLMNMQSPRVFQISKLIEKDIQKTGIPKPEIDRENLQYFKFSVPERYKAAGATVYNVDIKSAYATLLFVNKIITRKTFAILSKLEKADRLASVGMLASRKNIFIYQGDEVKSFTKEESPFANWFYYCVHGIGEIMTEAARLIGSDFICFWVDGIYCEQKDNADLLQAFFKDKGFLTSCDTLNNFHVVESAKKHKLYFSKDGQEKYLTVPKPSNKVTQEVIKLMGLHSAK